MGAKPSMVSALLKGERRLNEDWIEKFFSALGITLGDIEEATPRIPEPKILREYLEKLQRLYEISPVPAFRSAGRVIDDWLEAVESFGAAEPKTTDSAEELIEAEHIEESDIDYLDSDAPQPVEIFRVRHYDAIPAGDSREMNAQGQMWMDIVHSKGKDS